MRVGIILKDFPATEAIHLHQISSRILQVQRLYARQACMHALFICSFRQMSLNQIFKYIFPFMGDIFAT